ncbi:MAG: sensor histidine kinase [Bacillaceae bacterium]|nr:sensor histidine kinase [Bacillaceae bacterium]
MLERMGILVTIAFLLTRVPVFRNMLRNGDETIWTRVRLIVAFGVMGIIGTYTGVPVDSEALTQFFPSYSLSVDEAIANARVVGVATAGLLGGPMMGLGAGVIAGLHRLSLGGFTAFACGVSTIVEGLFAGWVGRKYGKEGFISLRQAFLTGFLAETLQMVIILLLARPFPKALGLVEVIGVPMIVANSIGITIFIAIIKLVYREEERFGALQAQTALKIADRTLSYLRQGLSPESARAAAGIILEETRIAAVAVTDREQILAHVGVGSDHHHAGSRILTRATREVLETGQLKVARSLEDIHCSYDSCPLQAAIIMPLSASGRIVGSLKLYFLSSKQINSVNIELARGLAKLFSNQLELSELERQARLARDAEIRSLQSQISPHFLFNSLNTIVSLCRTNPEEARELLIQLGHFLRQNIRSSVTYQIPLSKEIEHVQAYMAIEMARFSDKIFMEVSVDENIDDVRVPPLILQPLVENALNHGVRPLNREGIVYVRITNVDEGIRVEVIDNGKGMEPQIQKSLLEGPVDSPSGTGTGLYSVHQRLVGLFGEQSGLRIESAPDQGTSISFTIPKTGKGQKVVAYEDSYHDRGRRDVIS